MIDVTPAEFEEVAKECGYLVPEIEVTDRARERVQGRESKNFVARVGSEPAGLLIGYDAPDGPQPRQVIERLRDLSVPVVMGNMDAWSLAPRFRKPESDRVRCA